MQPATLLAAASLLALAPALAEAQTRPRVDVTARAAERPAREIGFAAQPHASGVLILPVTSEPDLDRVTALDAATRDALVRGLTAAEFDYASGNLSFRGLGTYDQIIVQGVASDAHAADLHRLGVSLGRTLLDQPAPVSIVHSLSADQAAEIATGIGIGGYSFDRYKTPRAPRPQAGPIVLVGADGSAAFAGRGQGLVEAMRLTRDLGNEPANVIYPETFVERTQAAFRGVRGVDIEVLDEAEMARLGMGSLLSVGQGSERPSRMMVITYRGPSAPDRPVVLAGKGITFDTGGISLKPGAGMGAMKMDMSGAASVVGTALALARSSAPVHVVAIAALAENMPSGSATRPADIVRAMNGKTIEVISTDAEGRMVLADALSWAEANLDPAVIVDIATLTGAVGTALGDDYAGLFTRQDALADQLLAASEATGEGLWRLPLHPSYAADLRSPVADLKHTGGTGAGAGVGAHFIGEFVNPDTPWAHLDIAGVDSPDGMSAGYGVRLLERFVLDWQPVAVD